MKANQAYIVFALVLTLNGQGVFSEDESPEPSEGDNPAVAAVVIPDGPVGSLAESPVGSPRAADSQRRHSNDFIYGKYNPSKCCWRKEPKAPRLIVGYRSQSEEVRRKLEFKLMKNNAVKQAISRNAMNCEKSHWGSEGLLDNCPSKFYRATEVKLFGKTCYIVRPHQQCVTFRKCDRKSPCVRRRTKKDDTQRRSLPLGPLRRRGASPRHDACDRTSMSSSTCVPDGYRTFQAWVHCNFCGFKLLNLKLPQCCSCKRYSHCDDVIPQN